MSNNESVHVNLHSSVMLRRTEAEGAPIEVIVETPHDCDHRKAPLIIKGGFLEPHAGLDGIRHAIASSDNRVVATVSSPRKQHWEHRIRPSHLTDVNRLQTDAVLAGMDLLGYDKYALLGNSFGGKAVLTAAATRPESASSVVLLSSVGIDVPPDKAHSIWQMVGRSIQLMRKETVPNASTLIHNGGTGYLRQFSYYAGVDVARTVREGHAAATASLHDQVLEVREAGVPVGGVYCEDDSFFHADDVRKYGALILDALDIQPGIHLSNETEPEPIGARCVRMLTTLEAQTPAAP